MKKLSLFLTVILVLSLALFSCGKGKSKYATIGTGGVTGVYYPTGGAISKMINAKSDTYGIRTSVESTGGSVYNINAVLSGDLEFGIAQSDRQFQAMKGLAEWKDKGEQKKLRSVFSIHPEALTCVASVKSGINTIKDLKGKKVNLGNPGSGQLENSKDALEAFGMTEKDLKAEHIKAVEAAGLLQDERIDAYFYTVGHPNGSVKEATSGRIKVKVVEIAGKELDALIKKDPFYARAVIEMKNYPSAANKKDVNTIGVKATLVTSSDVSADVVYAITKEVFENLEEFKKIHPAFSVLTKENMLEGLSAPLHPGAVKYFKEAGLDKIIKPELLK